MPPKSQLGRVATRRKQRIGRITRSPRIIILDNDETTGSYWPLFKLLHLFRDNDIENIHIQELVPYITQFCLKSNIFRPGIEKFIQTLQTLRAANRIDTIVMYTYQQESLGRKDDWDVFHNSYGQQINVPFLINYCFGYIASKYKEVRPFFDTIITRNIHNAFYGRSVEEPFNEKSLDVVFKEARIHPTHDLRGITFIDDCYMNTAYPSKMYNKRTIIGPLSSIYIEKYSLAVNDISSLINEANVLYKNILYKYIPDNIYNNFRNSIKNYQLGDYGYMAVCTPPDKELSYTETDLTKLAGRIRKYYAGL